VTLPDRVFAGVDGTETAAAVFGAGAAGVDGVLVDVGAAGVVGVWVDVSAAGVVGVWVGIAAADVAGVWVGIGAAGIVVGVARSVAAAVAGVR
jgi:hypothetical protein